MEGKYRSAIKAARRARKLGEESDSATIMGVADYRLASAHCVLGEFAASAERAASAMAHLAPEATSLFLFGGLTYTFVCSFRALACAELGDFETAEAAGLEGYRIAKEANHAYSVTVSCFGLAHAYLLRERYREALPVLNDGMKQIADHGLHAIGPWVARRFAHALAMAGEEDKAREMVEAAYSPGQLPGSMDHGLNYIFSGRACLAVGALDRAEEIAQIALEKAERDEEAAVRAWATWIQGETALKRAKAEAAAAYFASALDQAGRLGMATLEAYALLGHGDALAAAGVPDAAQTAHTRARDLATKHDLAPVLTRVTERLAG